jgi:hypothetical protein
MEMDALKESESFSREWASSIMKELCRNCRPRFLALPRGAWIEAGCSVALFAWVLMVELAGAAQVLGTFRGAAGFWAIVARLASPPVKLWALLLIPCSVPVAFLLLVDKSGKWLEWYTVAALALVLVIGFGLLRTIQWGLGFFPTGSALGL